MCSRISWCFGRSFFIEHIKNLISNLPEGHEKDFLKIRYLRVVQKLEESTKRSGFWYNSLTFVVTVGSILVPALISIQDRGTSYDDTEEEKMVHSNNIYWTVWGISLSVTISNALIKMLSLDKTYITRNIKLNQFKSEGAMFISKTGPYDIEDDTQRFRLFVQNIESLKKKQVLEEYTYQQTEANNNEEERIDSSVV